MTKIIVVRTAHTNWNVIQRIQGTVDVPLNEEGKLSAKRVAYELRKMPIDCIFSSELSRSIETAELIAIEHNLKIRKMKSLNELNQGVWQGLTLTEIKRRYKKQYLLWKTAPLMTKPPQGESVKDAYDRVISCVMNIVQKNKGKVICLVAHEVAIAFIKCYYQNLDVNDMWDIVFNEAQWEQIEIED